MPFLHPFSLALVCLALLLPRAVAAELPAPTGLTILSVGGSITHTTDGGRALFDRAGLETLEQREIETRTIWTDGPQRFTGVPLRALLEAVGATGHRIRATAINDYAIEFPLDDATADAPVIAYLNHGAAMSVRDKGPLWLVYPYDADPIFRTDRIYARSIWQLDRIDVLE